MPPSETQPPKKSAAKRVDRKITPQRKKKCIPSNPVEDARAKRRQAMIAACEQAEQRLRAGRERALETRRALDKIWKRVALELKESDKKSKEVFSCLIARQREKQKEMHDWVESATKASREFSKKLREELKVDTSVGGQGLKEMKLCPASQSGEEDRTKSSSRAAGLAEKLGKECSELNEGENTTALEKSVQGVKREKVGCCDVIFRHMIFYYFASLLLALRLSRTFPPRSSYDFRQTEAGNGYRALLGF